MDGKTVVLDDHHTTDQQHVALHASILPCCKISHAINTSFHVLTSGCNNDSKRLHRYCQLHKIKLKISIACRIFSTLYNGSRETPPKNCLSHEGSRSLTNISASILQMAAQSVQPFLQGSQTDTQTSVTIGLSYACNAA